MEKLYYLPPQKDQLKNVLGNPFVINNNDKNCVYKCIFKCVVYILKWATFLNKF